MNDNVAIIVAFIAVLPGLLALAVSWRTSKASAKKDEVDALCDIIDKLRERITELEAEVRRWKERYGRLRQWVIERTGIDPNDRPTGRLDELNEEGMTG